MNSKRCRRRWRFSSLWALAGAAACWSPVSDVTGEPGTPLPGLTESQLAQFERGREWFDRRYTPEEGLGPLYIQQGCNSCHDLPTLGGTGVETVTEFTYFQEADGCDALEDQGGSFLQERSTEALQALGIDRESLPPEATGRVTMTPPLLYGLGLAEAIPDETIMEMADPDDVDGDGISGRVSRLPDGRIGRLLRKAGVATIEELVEAALWLEMGITTPNYPEEVSFGGHPIPPEADPAPDPEITQEVIEAIADFVRFLAPPSRAIAPAGPARRSVEEGERVFHAIGCASCHVPTLRTGPSDIQALDRKTVTIYSDMLLHDLGPELANICGPTATPSELRTARLTGLRYRLELLHDGRAKTTERAILLHGGEAQRASALFGQLRPEARENLLRFLESL